MVLIESWHMDTVGTLGWALGAAWVFLGDMMRASLEESKVSATLDVAVPLSPSPESAVCKEMQGCSGGLHYAL